MLPLHSLLKVSMKKECIECQSSFRGRSDKKFCCGDCRSAYNNRKNRDQNNLMRNINNCLRKNRRILLELCRQQIEKVERHRLAQKGFRFGYCTHIEKADKKQLHYCYDIAYYESDKHIHLVD